MSARSSGCTGVMNRPPAPQVIATLSVEFDDKLDVPRLEKLIGRIESELRGKHPDLFRVFVRPTPSADGRQQVDGEEENVGADA